MTRARLRELLGPALFEAAFVVFGLVAAYAVNAWREARVHRQDAANARTAIVRELEQNRRSAAASLAYHTRLLDTLGALRRTNAPSGIGVFSRGFVMPARLGATAWTVASETGALNHMRYDDVLRFSRLYAEQRRYDEQTNGVSQIIYGELYRTGPVELASHSMGIASLIGAFQHRERALLALYDSILAPPASIARMDSARR